MARRIVLVSGAGGFIGRWSVPRLLALGYDVHAVIGRTPHREIPPPLHGATLHRADLLDPGSVDALLNMVKPSHLLHFAWIATPGLYWTSVQNYRWVGAGERLLQSFRPRAAFAPSWRAARRSTTGRAAVFAMNTVVRSREAARRPQRVRRFATGTAAFAGRSAAPYAECKIAMQQALAQFGKTHRMSTAWGAFSFSLVPMNIPIVWWRM